MKALIKIVLLLTVSVNALAEGGGGISSGNDVYIYQEYTDEEFQAIMKEAKEAIEKWDPESEGKKAVAAIRERESRQEVEWRQMQEKKDQVAVDMFKGTGLMIAGGFSYDMAGLSIEDIRRGVGSNTGQTKAFRLMTARAARGVGGLVALVGVAYMISAPVSLLDDTNPSTVSVTQLEAEQANQ